jgi:hypothetical protein
MKKWGYNLSMEKRPIETSPRLRPLADVEYGRFLLDVPAGTVVTQPETEAYATQHGFRQKDEQHVTVIGKRTQQLLNECGKLDEVMSIASSVADWPIAEYGDIVVLKNTEVDEKGYETIEESIVRLIALPEIDRLYDQIRAITGMSIETPPPHVTLYTKNADRGIGVYSRAQLEGFVVDRLLDSSPE